MQTTQTSTEHNRDAADKVVQQLKALHKDTCGKQVRELVEVYKREAYDLLLSTRDQLREMIRSDIEERMRTLDEENEQLHRTAAALGVTGLKKIFTYDDGSPDWESDPLEDYDGSFRSLGKSVEDGVLHELLPSPDVLLCKQPEMHVVAVFAGSDDEDW